MARAARPGDRPRCRADMLNRFTHDYLESLGVPDFAPAPSVSGRLASFDGLLMEAVGPTPAGRHRLPGWYARRRRRGRGDRFPQRPHLVDESRRSRSLLPQMPVRPLGAPGEAEVGPRCWAVAVDGAGKPIDGLGPIRRGRSLAARRQAAKPARPWPRARTARCRRARDQRPAHHRPGPAYRHHGRVGVGKSVRQRHGEELFGSPSVVSTPIIARYPCGRCGPKGIPGRSGAGKVPSPRGTQPRHVSSLFVVNASHE